MRKFIKMKSNTEMSLTNLVLNANILIEFSFWFNFVHFFNRNSLKMITCLIILYRCTAVVATYGEVRVVITDGIKEEYALLS